MMKFKPLTIINGSPAQVYINTRLNLLQEQSNTIYLESIPATWAKWYIHVLQMLIRIPKRAELFLLCSEGDWYKGASPPE